MAGRNQGGGGHVGEGWWREGYLIYKRNPQIVDFKGWKYTNCGAVMK